MSAFATNASNAINYSVGYDNLGDFLSNTPNTVWGQVSVDNQEPLEFTNKDNLYIYGQAGSNVINLNNPNKPAGSNTTTTPGLASINVSGDEPPGSGATSAGDTLIVNGVAGTTDGFQYNPTGVGAGNVTDTGVQPTVFFTAIASLSIVGQDADGDTLDFNTPTGTNTLAYTPGSTADAGEIDAIKGGGTGPTLVPLSFAGFAGGITFTNASSTATDYLTVNGTSGDDGFLVNSPANTVQLFKAEAGTLETPLLTTTGITDLTLNGQGGVDRFNLYASLPYHVHERQQRWFNRQPLRRHRCGDGEPGRQYLAPL